VATVVAETEETRRAEAEARARALRRQLQAALAGLLVLALALVGVGIFAAHRLYTNAEERYIDEALPLRSATRDLILQVVNEQAAVRAYVISATPASLGPYRTAKQAVASDLAELRAAVSRRPRIGAEVATVQEEVRGLEAYFAEQIALVRSGPAGQSRAQREVLGGEERFEGFRTASRRLSSGIDVVVASAQRQQRRTYQRTLVFLAADGAIAVLIGLGLLLVLPERFQRLYRREQFARARAERGARAARALTHVDEAVILLDGDDTIAYWNAEAEALFGDGEHSVVGVPVAAAIDEFPLIEATAAGRDADLFPMTVDGEERWFSAAQSRFPGGRVVVVRDLTEAQALERARTDFVATAAHELRTPVAAVFGAARTLGRRDVTLTKQTREEFLGLIESESERLARIIEQILTAAQLDRGDLRLEVARCDLRALCEETVRSAEMSRPDGISIRLDAPEPFEPVQCDAGRLRQVLANLVENAIKYSPEGGRVEVRLRDDDDRVKIEVQDQGLGIPASERDRIFEKFYRLDPALSRGVGGSGLGLYITRQLVEQMDGRVSVTSGPEAGSTFTVELPRRLRTPPAGISSTPPRARG
jgi:PAS domain S-box-containing protein